jgi:hypothetical protein
VRTAIIAYDLREVIPTDNSRVKIAICSKLGAKNIVPAVTGKMLPRWVNMKLPDTTLCVDVPDEFTCEQIARDVESIINSTGAIIDKVFVGFLQDTFYILNSNPI